MRFTSSVLTPESFALTEDYHPDRDISEATHHITMRHNGIDCRQISKAKHNMCNKGYVEEEGGNSCAQVTSRAHRIGFETGKAVDIAQNSPNQSVHFSAALSSSLNYWTAGVVNTCGMVSTCATLVESVAGFSHLGH